MSVTPMQYVAATAETTTKKQSLFLFFTDIVSYKTLLLCLLPIDTVKPLPQDKIDHPNCSYVSLFALSCPCILLHQSLGWLPKTKLLNIENRIVASSCSYVTKIV